MRGSTGRAILVVSVIAGALAAAPAAHAAIRYAEPGIGGSDPACPQADPCDLQEAVESAGNGDEVIVTQGTYNEGASELIVPQGVNVHGVHGQPLPTIISTAVNQAVSASVSGARVADLVIVYTAPGTFRGISLVNAVVGERLYVVSSGTVACGVLGAVLRDSVCWVTGANGNAVSSSAAVNTTITTTLRNVTAIADGTSSDGIDFASSGGLDHTIDAKNVIADGVAEDVLAQADATSTTAVDLTSSNYADTDAIGAGATITTAGSGTNQLSAPQFVNRAGGDFHQAAGSPTIDAGTTNALGAQDLDGEARSQGAAPDIGADEFPVAATTPPNGDRFAPDTGIRKGPKQKTPKRKAKLEFGGSEPGVTFECQLDDNGFEPCTSPVKLRGLTRGKHVFAVRAVDAAGNADPTPADRRWKVTKKKKRK